MIAGIALAPRRQFDRIITDGSVLMDKTSDPAISLLTSENRTAWAKVVCRHLCLHLSMCVCVCMCMCVPV